MEEETFSDFDKIEVGQWVWTARRPRWSFKDDKVRRIHEVTRVTETLIICDKGDTYDRFRRNDGWGWAEYNHQHIIAVATSEEISTIGIPLKRDRDVAQANKRHRAKVENEISAAIRDMFSLSEEERRQLIEAIKEGRIPHVSIVY